MVKRSTFLAGTAAPSKTHTHTLRWNLPLVWQLCGSTGVFLVHLWAVSKSSTEQSQQHWKHCTFQAGPGEFSFLAMENLLSWEWAPQGGQEGSTGQRSTAQSTGIWQSQDAVTWHPYAKRTNEDTSGSLISSANTSAVECAGSPLPFAFQECSDDEPSAHKREFSNHLPAYSWGCTFSCMKERCLCWTCLCSHPVREKAITS